MQKQGGVILITQIVVYLFVIKIYKRCGGASAVLPDFLQIYSFFII